MAVKRMRVVAGPNGSGKSTVAVELLRNHPDWLGVWINADEIEATLRAGPLDLAGFEIPWDRDILGRLREFCLGSGLMEKTGDAERIVNSMVLDGRTVSLPQEHVNSYVAGTVADFLRHECLRAGLTFTFETVMSSPDKIKLMRMGLDAGYRTYLYFVGTSSPDINVDRVAQRYLSGGHPVHEDKIRSRYVGSLAQLGDASLAATRTYVFDNSGDAHQLVAEVNEEGAIHFPLDEIPAWLAETSFFARFVDQLNWDEGAV